MSDEAETPDAPAEAGERADPRPVVVLGGTTADDAGAGDLGSSLGREVVTLDPCLLDGEAFTRLGEAAAVIVPWDLGTQAGLDIVEALRSDTRVEDTPIVMSSPEPTRAAVRLALKAGATGFIFEPFQADEVRPHLSAPAAEESSDPTASEDPGETEEGETEEA